MDIMDLATKALASKLGGSSNTSNDMLTSVIGNLLGGSSDSKGIDLGSLIGNLNNSGLGDLASSWLGDGSNADISSSQLENLLGSDKIQQAASQLGTNQNDLLSGLKEMIPQVVDKSSSGGSLLDSVGGLSGLAGLASKFLK